MMTILLWFQFMILAINYVIQFYADETVVNDIDDYSVDNRWH